MAPFSFLKIKKPYRQCKKNFALYADNFPTWGLQAQGIALFTIWSALAAENIGASIQHYNPIIDGDVRKEWGIPNSWTLLGQMPFGSISNAPAPKEPVDIAVLVRSHQ